MNIEDAKILLKSALHCPWCDVKPNLKTKCVGHRDDPDRLMYLECPTCGISKSTYVKDSEQDKAVSMEYTYETAVSIVCLPRLIEIWNKRL